MYNDQNELKIIAQNMFRMIILIVSTFDELAMLELKFALARFSTDLSRSCTLVEDSFFVENGKNEYLLGCQYTTVPVRRLFRRRKSRPSNASSPRLPPRLSA